MDKLLLSGQSPKELSSLSLAFVGDSVYDLLVREYLLTGGNRRVGELNKDKVSMVCCASQRKALEHILPYLSEEEADVFHRGRNVTVRSVPRNSTLQDYHAATGLEALFGYLYLCDRGDRLRELFGLIVSETCE